MSDREIERLKAMIVDYEYIGELEREVQHLRSALERIANPITDDEVHWINTDEIVAIARAALQEIERLQKRVEGLERDRWKPEAQRTNERLRAAIMRYRNTLAGTALVNFEKHFAREALDYEHS